MLNYPPSRTQVRRVTCPACGARNKQRCRNMKEQERERNHMERVNAYINARDWYRSRERQEGLR